MCRISASASRIDFETQPTGATPSPALIEGVTFAADALGVVSLLPFPVIEMEVEGNAIATLDSGTVTSGPYLPMSLSFAEPVAQIGFGIWDLNAFGNTLEAYDEDDLLIGSLTVPGEALGPPGGSTATFIGFVSDTPNIARVVFTPISTGEFYAIDNVLFTTDLPDPDADADCVPDFVDNCLFVSNEDQRDTNSDNFGNACDADINNDCTVNAVDLGLFRAQFFTTDGDTDFNGDGTVNVGDLGILRSLFFQPPGPSALANACDTR